MKNHLDRETSMSHLGSKSKLYKLFNLVSNLQMKQIPQKYSFQKVSGIHQLDVSKSVVDVVERGMGGICRTIKTP